MARLKESHADFSYFKSQNEELRDENQRLQAELRSKSDELDLASRTSKAADAIITDSLGTPQPVRKALVRKTHTLVSSYMAHSFVFFLYFT